MHRSVEKDAPPLPAFRIGMQPVFCHLEEEKRGGEKNLTGLSESKGVKRTNNF
jgi:hypothetical protein